MLAPASRLLTTPRRARARDRQTKPFASALALASSPSSRAGPESQLPNASRLVASTRGLRRVVTRVSLAYPLARILEPQKEVDSRLVVCAVSKSIYRGRVTDPRVTLFGYSDNNVCPYESTGYTISVYAGTVPSVPSRAGLKQHGVRYACSAQTLQSEARRLKGVRDDERAFEYSKNTNDRTTNLPGILTSTPRCTHGTGYLDR